MRRLIRRRLSVGVLQMPRPTKERRGTLGRVICVDYPSNDEHVRGFSVVLSPHRLLTVYAPLAWDR